MNKSTVGRTRATAFRIPGIPAEIPVILNNLRKVSLGFPSFLRWSSVKSFEWPARLSLEFQGGFLPAAGPRGSRKSRVGVSRGFAAEAGGDSPGSGWIPSFFAGPAAMAFFAPRLRKIQNPGPGGHESCSRCFRSHESFCPKSSGNSLIDYSSEGYSCACVRVCANPVPKGQIQHLESACTSAPAPFASTLWWCCRLGRGATTWECIGKVN